MEKYDHVTCVVEFCPSAAAFSRLSLFGPLFMRLPTTLLNRHLPYGSGYPRFVRKDLAGKPNGPYQKEHTLRSDDYEDTVPLADDLGSEIHFWVFDH